MARETTVRSFKCSLNTNGRGACPGCPSPDPVVRPAPAPAESTCPLVRGMSELLPHLT